MDILERQAGDLVELKRRTRREESALQRDRYRAVVMAIEGAEAITIAEKLERARRSVQDWCYAYRDGGIDALLPKPRPGAVPKLPREKEEALRARIEAGPTEADGVCTLRGKDIQRILEAEFGKIYSLNGVYQLLHRLGYSCLVPRPRHEKQNPKKQEEFKEVAPLLFEASARCSSSKRPSAESSSRAESASSSWTKRGSDNKAR